MTRVKICGLTNIDDARAAMLLGADALGFIAVPGTPRYLGPEQFQAILSALNPGPFISTVLVTRCVADVADYSTPSAIQYYEDGADGAHEYSARIRVVRVKSESDLTALDDLTDRIRAVLLDTYHDGKLGGGGQTFDWRLAQMAAQRTRLPLILAGGLTPKNVADALEQVRPYAVDVSSGVEAEPGRKEHCKIRAFIQAVRAWDTAREGH